MLSPKFSVRSSEAGKNLGDDQQDKKVQTTNNEQNAALNVENPRAAVNINVAENLSKLKDVSQLKEMAQIVSVSSKLVLFHANDMLDHRLIQVGNFAPAF